MAAGAIPHRRVAISPGPNTVISLAMHGVGKPIPVPRVPSSTRPLFSGQPHESTGLRGGGPTPAHDQMTRMMERTMKTLLILGALALTTVSAYAAYCIFC